AEFIFVVLFLSRIFWSGDFADNLLGVLPRKLSRVRREICREISLGISRKASLGIFWTISARVLSSFVGKILLRGFVGAFVRDFVDGKGEANTWRLFAAPLNRS